MTTKRLTSTERIVFDFVWIVDHSGSMGHDARLQKAIQYTRETLAMLPSALRHESPNVDVRFGCIAGGNPDWVITPGTPIEAVSMPQLSAGGHSPLGKMLSMVADSEMRIARDGTTRLVLIAMFTDGYATDDWKAGLARLRCSPSFAGQSRLAIPRSLDFREDVLGAFVSENAPDPREMDKDPSKLRHYAAGLVRASA